MKAPLRDELLQVFRGLRMYSAHEFSLGGGPRVDSRSRGGVLPALTLELYRRCYLRPGGEPAPPPDTAFAQRLWEAGFLPPKWDFGWSVYQRHPDGELSVRKADCYRLARPGEYALSGPPGSPPGSEVALRTPQPFFDPQTGFLWLTGQTPADDFDDRQTVRIYFHLRARFAAALAGGITRQWNRYQVPFRFKCPVRPELYQRADAGVLYLARRHFAFSARLVSALAEQLPRAFRPAVPLFTRRFRNGIGLAEDPAGEESFGMHRCRLVAEAMIQAWRRGRTSADERLAEVERRFVSAGLDPGRPHLNPGSVELPEAARLPA